MFTERNSIRQEMEWIREEIRSMKERYYYLQTRLSQLDKNERESIDTESIMFNLMRTVETLSNLVHVSPTDIINNIKNSNPTEEMIQEEQKEKLTIKTKDIEITKEKERKLNRKSNDIKSLTLTIVSILKEKGSPMGVREIEKILEERNNLIKTTNFSYLMNSVMKYDPRIIRPIRGYYQIKL